MLKDNFIKRYETADFISKSITPLQVCEQALIHFLQTLEAVYKHETVLSSYNGRLKDCWELKIAPEF